MTTNQPDRFARIEEALARSTQLLERAIGVQDTILSTQEQQLRQSSLLEAATQHQGQISVLLETAPRQQQQISILLEAATRHEDTLKSNNAMIIRLDTVIEWMIYREGREDNNEQ